MRPHGELLPELFGKRIGAFEVMGGDIVVFAATQPSSDRKSLAIMKSTFGRSCGADHKVIAPKIHNKTSTLRMHQTLPLCGNHSKSHCFLCEFQL
tara:strand:- start:659 stop:943 length:285 start_codon:yes stop_codon:yes gene_type:complete